MIWDYLNYLLKSLQTVDCRSPFRRQRHFICNQMWSISPYITVRFLECVNFVTETDISLVYFISLVYDSLTGLFRESLPGNRMLQCLLYVEWYQDDLILFHSILHHFKKALRFTCIDKGMSCSCFTSVIQEWFFSSLETIQF